MRWDVRAFDLFAPVYDLFVPSADDMALRKGFRIAERDLDRIIDLGGGTGRVARTVGATVLDPARGMLRRAHQEGIESVQASATHLPHPDDSVDAVVIVDAFHHFPNGEMCLAEIARVLAPGGVLVITDFDRSTRRGRLLDRAEAIFRFDSTFYTAQELESMIVAAGLEPHPIEYGFEMTIGGVATEA